MAINLDHEGAYTDLPAVPVLLRNLRTGRSAEFEAIVDTGAESTLLDEAIAVRAGLDLDSAASALIGGVGGGLIGAYKIDVELLLLGQESLRVVLPVAFAPGVSDSVGNLLGLDVWSTIDVGVSHRNRTAYVGRSV